MWLKKQSVIASENGTTAQNMYAAAYDGSDYRNATQHFNEYFNTNNNIIGSRPTKSRISDYFYLPAKGFYHDGKLQHVGRLGYYWSATGVKNNNTHAFSLAFSSNSVSIGNNVRSYGFSEELKW